MLHLLVEEKIKNFKIRKKTGKVYIHVLFTTEPQLMKIQTQLLQSLLSRPLHLLVVSTSIVHSLSRV